MAPLTYEQVGIYFCAKNCEGGLCLFWIYLAYVIIMIAYAARVNSRSVVIIIAFTSWHIKFFASRKMRDVISQTRTMSITSKLFACEYRV